MQGHSPTPWSIVKTSLGKFLCQGNGSSILQISRKDVAAELPEAEHQFNLMLIKSSAALYQVFAETLDIFLTKKDTKSILKVMGVLREQAPELYLELVSKLTFLGGLLRSFGMEDPVLPVIEKIDIKPLEKLDDTYKDFILENWIIDAHKGSNDLT